MSNASVYTQSLSAEMRKKVVELVRQNPDLANEFFSHLMGTVSTTRRRSVGSSTAEVFPQYKYGDSHWYLGGQLSNILGQKTSTLPYDREEMQELFPEANPLVGRNLLVDLGVPAVNLPATTTSLVPVEKAVWYAMWRANSSKVGKAVDAVLRASQPPIMEVADPAPIVVANPVVIKVAMPADNVVETTPSANNHGPVVVEGPQINVPNFGELIAAQVTPAIAEAVQSNQKVSDVKVSIPFRVEGTIDFTVKVDSINIGK